MKFTIDLRKTVAQNAQDNFEYAKKLKKKLEGIKTTITKYESAEIKAKKDDEKKERLQKKEWYEKFHWFMTSQAHLCIGGKDAKTNEIVIKKHTSSNDCVFHTDLAGSPFFVLQLGKDTATEEELIEVATATACYSKAWKLGLAETKVFSISPDQLTKEAKAGEYLTTGSFVIKGSVKYIENKTELAIGINDKNIVIAGPESAIKDQTKQYAVLIPGDTKTSDIARKLTKRFGGDVDEYVRAIPAGGAAFKRNHSG